MSKCLSVSEGRGDELGSDIDLVVNSSALLGLVATFPSTLAGMRRWDTAAGGLKRERVSSIRDRRTRSFL